MKPSVPMLFLILVAIGLNTCDNTSGTDSENDSARTGSALEADSESAISFYIEHMKAMPTPPQCTTDIRDAEMPYMRVNLMIADDPGNFFQATNMLGDNTDKASSGIMIDGYELKTTIPGMGIVGGTEYFEYSKYVAPQTSDLLYATVLSSATTGFLRDAFHCSYNPPHTIADAIYSTTYRDSLTEKGKDVPAELNAEATSGDVLLQNLLFTAAMPDILYSTVRFIGHTMGGQDIETPEFTIEIRPWCGVEGGWEPCIDNICTAFCNAAASLPEFCVAGVNASTTASMTCADYLAGHTYSIESEQLDATTGQPVTLTQNICEYYSCR
ncbi:MAG: hypothetical protein JXX14_06245 [Deltaproteobacteria bacterium]|nr:hypothetical protein [Deltaproteobacteria bacterium]